jgi:hypothetical protein
MSTRIGRRTMVSGLALLMIAWSFAGAHAATVRTKLISQSSGGVQGGAESYLPSVSADGRLVAFESGSTNLIGNDTNSSTDIFVRDRDTNKTTRVSVSSSGAEANDGSYNAAISSGGRFVAFISDATNLVGGTDLNGDSDVFVRDRVKHVTKRVSVSSAGVGGNASSYDPSISADGRFVAFWSDSSNLVGNDTNAAFDIFVRDRERKTTKLVSVGLAGGSADASSYLPSISADGRFVAFESIATDLVPNDTNALRDVFVRDLRERRTKRHSLSSAGIQGNGDSRDAAISDDGRFVAFRSSATNLVGTDTNGYDDVFVRDRQQKTTRLISVSSTGVPANLTNYDPSVSADGRFVAFTSFASNLVGTDTNAQQDIFVRDRLQHTTRRVSVSSAGAEANGSSTGPSISDGGRLVAFYSGATNLVGNDTNNNDDIFVRGPS